MALADCLAKFGDSVTAEQRAAMENAIAAGATDEQAVRVAQIMAHKNVVDLAERVRDEGGTIKPVSNPIADMAQFQSRAIIKIDERRAEIRAEVKEMQDHYENITDLSSHFRGLKVPGSKRFKDAQHPDNDLSDNNTLMDVILRFSFNHPELRKGGAIMGLSGKDQFELFANFRRMQIYKVEIESKFTELNKELAMLQERRKSILSGKGSGDQTFFQSDLGFHSGLLTAARVLPQKKGSAQQMMATLKKQPNVKKEELEWLGVEEWAEAKGNITREELIDFIDTGGVQVLETVFGGQTIREPQIQFDIDSNATESLRETGDEPYGVVYHAYNIDSQGFGDHHFTVYVDSDSLSVSVQVDDTGEYLDVREHPATANQDINDAQLAIETYVKEQQKLESGFEGRALYEDQYQLDGGTDYREVMLHLPNQLSGRPKAADLVQSIVRKFKELPFNQRDKINKYYRQQSGIRAAARDDEGFSWAMRRGHVKPEHFEEQFGIPDSPIIQMLVDLKETKEIIKKQYTSHTFDDVKDILAWMRVKDRIGPNGEKILFVEELQSDWHQQGREMGYSDISKIKEAEQNALEAEKKERKAYMKAEETIRKIRATGTEGGNARSEGSMTAAQERVETVIIGRSDWQQVLAEGAPANDFHKEIGKENLALIGDWRLRKLEFEQAKRTRNSMSSSGIPDAPFKNNAWAELAMKRIIRMAAEGSYDQIAWTTGEQQADRYDLGEVVDSFEWSTGSDGGRTVELIQSGYGENPIISVNSEGVIDGLGNDSPADWMDKPLSALVGQANADRIMGPAKGEYLEHTAEQIKQGDIHAKVQTLENQIDGGDLRVGAEGMAGFYDKVLPNIVNKVARKLDKKARVERFGSRIDMPTDSMWKITEVGGLEFTGHYETEARARHAMEVDPTRTFKLRQPLSSGARPLGTVSNPSGEGLTIKMSDGSNYGVYQSDNHAEKVMKRMDVAGEPVHSMNLTDQMKSSAMEGQTLFQGGERASITFQKEAGAIIRMKGAKDLTSFLHEGAHLYLEMMADLAEMPGANGNLVEDYAKTLEYLGVSNRNEITREHHELWARSFEAYLREGKAPTAELQPLFSTFKGWFTRVYKQLSKLLKPGEELNDEIRGVFDRLVASEQQIEASEDFMGYVALYNSAEEMGVSQRVFDVYRSLQDEAHVESVDHETTKMIAAMEWGQKQWWKTERNKIADEIRAEAEKDPVFIALHFLQRGKNPDGTKSQFAPFKLSKADLLKRYGKDFIKRLPGRGRYGVYSAEGGIDVDVAAEMFGFKSGNELVQALIKSPNMEQYINELADRRMAELHPDPMNSAEMVDDATRAVHNEKRGRVLAAEMKAVHKQMAKDKKIVAATKKDVAESDRKARDANKGQLPKREDLAHIKAAAKAVIEGKRIRDINPNTYLQAERKAGRLAFEAMGKKDYAEAYRQKLIQIRNYEAYRAAVRAKAQSARDQKYLKTFEKKPKRARMGKAGVLEQIDAVIAGINFSNRSNKQLDQDPLRAELLPALRAAVEDGSLIIPESVLKSLETPGGINWREMTVEEFAGVRDVVKQIEHKAKTDYEVIINGEKVIIQENIDAVASSIAENSNVVAIPRGERSFSGRSMKSIRGGIGHWLRSSSIARILDNSGFGAVTRKIILPIRRAYVEKLIPRQQKAAEDLAAIYQKHYSNDEMASLSKVIEDENAPEQMSKSSILALGLNWGSESNRAAVLGGVLKDVNNVKSPAFTEQEVALLLSKLDARDWAFIQDIWDYQDSHYAELAETEKRRRGIAPQRVEALPFTIRTSDGTEVSVRGGYHPLQYNQDHGGVVSEKDFNDYFDRMAHGTYISSSTRAGATHERVRNHGKVVLLSLNTVDRNLRELLRDISLGDEVNLINRVLNSEEVSAAAKNTKNAELLNELRLWLSDAAVGELPAQTSWEKGLSWIRVGFTKSKLAFNVYVTALQLTGVFQSMAVIGSANYARGFGKFLTNPSGNYKMVMERSKFMEARYGILQTWDKDVQDTNNFMKSMFGPAPTKFKTAFDNMGHYYFYPIAKMQSMVDVTTWMGAYEKGLNEMELNEDDASQYADTQVEASQTSGLFSDRSGLERGTLGSRSRQSQFVRLWTTLISYMLAKGNIAYEKQSAFNKNKSMKAAVQLATDYIMLFMIEGIASSILYDQWPGDEDEDETVGGWVLNVTKDSVLSGIPLVREYSSAKYGSGNTPIGAFVNDLYKFNVQAAQGEMDEAAVKAFVKVQGTLFHLPASQVNRAVEAAMSDDDTALYEYFTGKRDE